MRMVCPSSSKIKYYFLSFEYYGNVSHVEIFSVDKVYAENILDKSILRPFRGTREIQQLIWNRDEPQIIRVRCLSCLTCNTQIKSIHFELGTIRIDYKPDTSQISVAFPPTSNAPLITTSSSDPRSSLNTQ